jgi:hypothetical protein
MFLERFDLPILLTAEPALNSDSCACAKIRFIKWGRSALIRPAGQGAIPRVPCGPRQAAGWGNRIACPVRRSHGGPVAPAPPRTSGVVGCDVPHYQNLEPPSRQDPSEEEPLGELLRKALLLQQFSVHLLRFFDHSGKGKAVQYEFSGSIRHPLGCLPMLVRPAYRFAQGPNVPRGNQHPRLCIRNGGRS